MPASESELLDTADPVRRGKWPQPARPADAISNPSDAKRLNRIWSLPWANAFSPPLSSFRVLRVLTYFPSLQAAEYFPQIAPVSVNPLGRHFRLTLFVAEDSVGPASIGCQPAFPLPSRIHLHEILIDPGREACSKTENSH